MGQESAENPFTKSNSSSERVHTQRTCFHVESQVGHLAIEATELAIPNNIHLGEE